MSHPTIGIILGGGDFPLVLATHLKKNKIPYCLFPVLGTRDIMNLKDHPHHWIALGRVQVALDLLRAQGVSKVVFAGYINRASIFKTCFDMKGLRWLWSLIACFFKDNSLLNTVIIHFQDEGFSVLGGHEIVPDLLMPHGCLTPKKPTAADMESIHIGVQGALDLGRKDRGQAVVVSQKKIVGRESKKGTDHLIDMIRGTGSFGKDLILVKMARPQQDLRIDLPTIGPRTIVNLAKSGYKGLCLEAGAGVLLNRKDVISLAKKHSLFIYGYQNRT